MRILLCIEKHEYDFITLELSYMRAIFIQLYRRVLRKKKEVH